MTRRHLPSPKNWTLRAQLLAGILVLFTVVMLGTGVLTVFATRNYLAQGLETDLNLAADRGGVTAHIEPDARFDDDGPTRFPGSGTVVLRLALNDGQVVSDDRGDPINQVVDRSNTPTTLSREQIATLQAAGLGQEPKQVDLGTSVGTYLLVAATDSHGDTHYTGVPIGPLNETVNELVNLVAVGTILGLVVVGGVGSYLIRRNLEPLARVAATAREVSAIQLDSGDVVLPARVPTQDTNPRTEVGQVGLALNNLLDDVESALQARQDSEMRVRQFVADASHELRTPLASIRGYAELSRRESEPVPASITHALGRVESEALRMSSLVEDLLLLARLDEGRPLARDEVDLSLLAIDAVSDAHAASPEHEWQLDLPDEPVAVVGDQQRLHQVLTNLLANARTHTPEGTTVITSIRDDLDGVRVSVTDNGPGIPESLQRTVFQRFTRGDTARNRAGGSTGLGLSIVAAVSQAHGGRVSVDSEPGRTTFSVLLPKPAVAAP